MDSSIQNLKLMLDGCAARHRVLAHNLANAETPNFKRQDINFKETLTKAINGDNRNGDQQANFQINTDTRSPSALNGNNVSIQRELGMILQNSMLYNTATTALSHKFARLRQAVRGP